MGLGFFWMGAIAVSMLACSQPEANVAAGNERGECYPNGTCNRGLSCFSNRCVRYEAGGIIAAAGGGDSAGSIGIAVGEGGAKAAGATNTSEAAAGSFGGGGGAAGSGMLDASGEHEAGGPVDAGTCKRDGGDPRTDHVITGGCGSTPGKTVNAYTGALQIMVYSIIGHSLDKTDKTYDDPFYHLDPNDLAISTGACLDCFRYNRQSEGDCVCSAGCTSQSYRVSDMLTDPYPPFDPTHNYTVHVDLSNDPPAHLHFGVGDCDCAASGGELDMWITPQGGTCVP